MTGPRCEHGDKVAYPDQQAAGIALTECKIRRVLRSKQNRREQRTYQCPHCHRWFLTSRPDLFAHT